MLITHLATMEASSNLQPLKMNMNMKIKTTIRNSAINYYFKVIELIKN
jgi:hypothetical protein